MLTHHVSASNSYHPRARVNNNIIYSCQGSLHSPNLGALLIGFIDIEYRCAANTCACAINVQFPLRPYTIPYIGDGTGFRAADRRRAEESPGYSYKLSPPACIHYPSDSNS